MLRIYVTADYFFPRRAGFNLSILKTLLEKLFGRSSVPSIDDTILEEGKGTLTDLGHENRKLRAAGDLMYKHLTAATDLLTELGYTGTALACYVAGTKWKKLTKPNPPTS